MLAAPRYEHDRLPGQVDAVDVDDPVDLVDGLGDGPYPPEALRMAPECPAGAGHVALPLLGEPPSEEAVELPAGNVVGVGGPRKAPRSLAALSILLVVLAPHEAHLHRVLPALVLPFLFISAPQAGHVFDFMAVPSDQTTF